LIALISYLEESNLLIPLTQVVVANLL